MNAKIVEKAKDKIREARKEPKVESRYGYIPFLDSDGEYLAEDEILFTDLESYENNQQFSPWEDPGEEYNVFTPGVKRICDGSSRFPIALELPDGKKVYVKVSKRTGEILPMHAGCCKAVRTILIGPSSVGKTISLLQYSDPSFHEMLAKDTECIVEDDLKQVVETTGVQRYEEIKRLMKKDKKLPAATKENEVTPTYNYYIRSRYEDVENKLLMMIDDIDGETCARMAWDNHKIFNNNHFILMIGADELTKEKNGSDPVYRKVLDGFLPRLQVYKPDHDYHVTVVITKSDRLPQDHPKLKGAFQNSVTVNDTQWIQTTHQAGFNYRAYEKRKECVREYIKSVDPLFYNRLTANIPLACVDFCMIASIGAECEDGKYTIFQPFCIDEPMVLLLARWGVYPVKPGSEPFCAKPTEKIIRTEKRTWVKEKVTHVCNKLLVCMGLGDDLEDDFEDEDCDEDDFEDGDYEEVDFENWGM